MPPSNWAPIVAAVKTPVALAALVVLVLMVLLRLALTKVPILRHKDGYRALMYVVTVIGLLALITVLGVLGLAFLQARRETAKMTLGRLDTENILQKHRGDIERCLRARPGVLFLDFSLRYSSQQGFDIDIYPGDQVREERALAKRAGVFERLPDEEARCEFLMGSKRPPQELFFVSSAIGFHPAVVTVGRQAAKLSINAPDTNRCILELLAPELNRYKLEPEAGFTHRLITDLGTELSR